MGLVSAFLLLSYLGLVAASSYPDQTSCDAYDPTLGDTRMFWVDPAVRTDAYTVRSGDGCGGDPTSYVPGQFMAIHVRTHKYKGQFRGILLYATKAGDPSGPRLGDWHLDWPNSNMFWKPVNAPCQNKSLMHLNGAEKYYHHQFMWVAPPAGTGAVEFHALIKRGEANTGEFYWPNAAGNLILFEGGAAPGNKWYEGAPGSTCTATCQGHSMPCDGNLLNNAYQYGSLLQKDVLATAGCNWPGVELDDTRQILKDSLGWCYYPSQLAGVGTGVCDMVAPNATTPMCPCGSDGRPSARVGAPPDTACLNGFVAMGSASRASSSFVSLALMLLAGFWFQPRRSNSALIVALVLGCAHVAQAHNWVYTVSRSFNQASTYKPCRPKVNDQPHWEINQGQTFNIEWATGHDYYFYFTIINSKDLEQLNNVTESELNDYLDTCGPADDYMRQHGGVNGINPVFWSKQHMEGNGNDINVVGLDNQPIYGRRLFANDTEYIKRHDKFGNNPYGMNEARFSYTQQNVVNDLRCSYYNNKYPFLIAVHRFVQVQTVMSRAGDRDIARFTIELSQEHKNAGYGQGSYIVQYLWRGYFDCVDVDVFVGTTVQPDLIGGRPLLATEPQWNKVDHCLFEEIVDLRTSCAEVVTDAKTILDDCADDIDCQGVNVVPLWLPNTVYPLFSDRVGIPWGMGCNPNYFANLGQGTRVAYGVTPRPPNSTFSSYSVTDDPEDPLFYSTCYVRKPQWKFDLSLSDINATVVVVPPPWAFSDRCVDCMAWKAAQQTSDVPVWDIPQRCRNCETETLPPVPVLADNTVAIGQKCDGSWTGGRTVWNFQKPPAQCGAGSRCVKTLVLIGTNVITANQCIAKAKNDPECSDYVQHQAQLVNGRWTYTCECWTKTDPGCCGQCKPVDFYADNWAVTVYQTTNPDADPACDNGIKSADGANCCPKSCGQCLGKPLFQVSFQPGTMVAPKGWARDTGAKYASHTLPDDGTQFPFSNTYGWNCDLTLNSDDRNPSDGTDFHSTVVKTAQSVCGTVPQWDLLVNQNGTYEVHVLYSRPNQQFSGCKLQGQPNFDSGFQQLSGNNMAWVVRSVDVTTGKITWNGANNDFSCSAIAALRVFPSAVVPPVDCRTLPGVCCSQHVDMADRPCSKFSPPCSLH